LILGLTIFLGTVGARIFKKFRIPQVVAYIIIGILLGTMGIGIIKEPIIKAFEPFNLFALGLIGFMIGGELKKEMFQKYGKQLFYILISEGLSAFLLVTLIVVLVGNFFFGSSKLVWAIGLLLGSIAAATAPAATTDVLWEYKTRGPLTTTVLGIVGMDDGLSLVLFAIASSIAVSLLGKTSAGILAKSFRTLYEIGGSIGLGILGGFALSSIVKKINEEYGILAFSIGIIVLILGIAKLIGVDILLAAMSIGFVVTNYIPRKGKEVFELIDKFSPPIYVLFFTFFGAKLNLGRLTLPLILLSVVYLLGRTMGKGIGASFGARLSGAPKTVQKYLPFCLFSQAGVAIGLSILATHRFPGEIGNAIVLIITTTTFIVQIIGPISTKWAVAKAGEVGLNITEEDIIRQSKAKDIMDKDVPLINENMSLTEILKVFSESNYLYYPVVNKEKKLLGVLTVDNIKNTLMTSGLNWFLLAFDLMEPPVVVTSPDTPMREVKELLSRHNLEYLPVVGADKKVSGFLEARSINRKISTKIIQLQKQAESLG